MSKRHMSLLILPGLLLLLASTVLASGNQVANASFEDPTIGGSYSHLDAIPHWALESGSKIEIQRNIFGPAADGSQYVELGSNAPSTIGQDVSTLAGYSYVLRFSYSPRPRTADNRFEVLWDNAKVASLSPTGQGQAHVAWQEFEGIVRASTGKTQLVFRDLSGRDAAGAFIDHVRLCRNLVTNDSFEDPAIGRSFSHLDVIPHWTLESGNKIEIQRSIFGPGADGSQYVELGSNAPSTVQQLVSTTPGDTYELRFSYSARPGTADNRFEVLWHGKQVASLSPSGQGQSQVAWQEFSGTVHAPGSEAHLTFKDLSGQDAAGALIDNVQVFNTSCQ